MIDATGAVAQPEMTVVINRGRIGALDQSSRAQIPTDAQVVNASGKFLIPGLWDMHAHLYAVGASYEFPLLIANGVTGVRDMGGILHQGQFDVWRQQIEQGKLLGPHLVVAEAIVDGPGSKLAPPAIAIGVGNAAEGRIAVDSLKRSGADFVKVYSRLPRDAYFAIADEARNLRLPFAGHVPDSVTATEASDAGQKSIEHLTGVALSCATNESELRTKVKKEWTRALTEDADWRTRVWMEAEFLDFYSLGRASMLFAHLVKNGTWQCPTLTELRSSLTEQRSPSNEALSKYIMSGLTPTWDAGNLPRKEQTKEDVARQKRRFRRELELVKDMHEAGVEFLAGTDMPGTNCLPGFCLHDELELLVQAGLTPMQALQTATLNPARYLGQEKELGTIEVGKLADLVLLDANPLADIRNTQRISAVVIRGHLLDRAKLDQLLAEIEAMAKRKP